MHEEVKDYYGQQLQSSSDLKTSACCDSSSVPQWLKPLLSKLHPEVLSRYYGCGLICPPVLEGCRVLDLGCGSGRDVYLLSQLVGPTGTVVGVDMTAEQLAVAKQHQAFHQEQVGFDNVQFMQGYIEKLEALDLEPGSFDVIVSNCVVNLSTDKEAVLKGVARLLKPGGEVYFSDVYADRRIPAHLQQDPVIYGECLGGALYQQDFLRVATAAGFADPRCFEQRPLTVDDARLAQKIGHIRFYSKTYRLFNIAKLESACEDYGQAVRYRGTVNDHPHEFVLDEHHVIPTGKMFPVCGNTWHMLQQTRFRDHFEFFGDFETHFGLFDGCADALETALVSENTKETASCC